MLSCLQAFRAEGKFLYTIR